MGKWVRRLILDDSYAIGRNESWFSYMAQKGLHLKKYGTKFVYFEKGEPKNTKYRIDIMYEQPSREQLDVYSQCGWQYVCKHGVFYVFSADEKSEVTELHSEPIEQGYTMIQLNKRLKNNLVIMSIAMAVFFALISSIYIFNDEPFLYMIQGQFIQQIALVMVELYVFYTVVRNYRAVSRLKNTLLQGEQINHEEDFKRWRRINSILAGIFLSIALFTLFIPIAEICKREVYTLPKEGSTLPIVKLAEIEQNEHLMRKESMSEEGIDFLNRVRYMWDMLAPIQYDIDERGVIQGEMWKDNSGEYSPSINTRYYKLTFSSMAENLIQDLISRYVYDDSIEIKEVTVDKLDKIYVAEDGIRKQIFAYVDNDVLYVSYYGNRELDHIIPLISERLEAYASNED